MCIRDSLYIKNPDQCVFGYLFTYYLAHSHLTLIDLFFLSFISLIVTILLFYTSPMDYDVFFSGLRILAYCLVTKEWNLYQDVGSDVWLDVWRGRGLLLFYDDNNYYYFVVVTIVIFVVYTMIYSEYYTDALNQKYFL